MSKLWWLVAVGVLGCSSSGDGRTPTDGGRGGESGDDGGPEGTAGAGAHDAGGSDAGPVGDGGSSADGGTGTSADGGTGTSADGGTGTSADGGTGTSADGGTGTGSDDGGAGNEGGSGETPLPDPCARVVCDSPPAPACMDDSTLTSHAGNGTCANAICSYAGTETDCTFGCAAGACKPDPCTAVSCNDPPAPSCSSASELVTYDPVGSCNDGDCTYTSHSVTCNCQGDACTVDPCITVVCDSPPTPTCKDGSTLTSYAPQGTCSAGGCSYAATSSQCPFGCESGACSVDPCAAVTCTQPPAPTCKDASTKITYPASGSCGGGLCSYAPTETACGSNQRCASAGVCSVCKTASSCGPSCSSCPGSAPICADLGATSKCVECLVDQDCDDPTAACDKNVCKPGTSTPNCPGQLRLPSVPWPAVGSKPYAVAAADFDGDGTIDLASVNHGSGDLTVLFGNGDGTYGASQTVSATYEALRAIEATDLDGDGRPELFVMSEYWKRLYIYPNDGAGVFLPPTTYQLETLYQPYYDGATRVRAADFNQDGDNDVAILSSGRVKILLGSGDGTLGTPVEYWAGPNPANGAAISGANLVVADLNGDEVLDLVTANTAHARLGILLGKGDGTFQDAYQIRGYTAPRAVAVADFDGDDKPDIAIANWSGRVKLLRGNGIGGFELAGNLTSELNPTDIVSADFNADGKNDLAVNHDSGVLRLFLGNGDGSFQADITYQGYADYYSDGLPHSLLTTDLNLDGVPDLVMANSGSNTLGILLGRQAELPKGPRVLPVSSATSIPFVPSDVTHVDFNRDGRMDLVSNDFETDEISVLLAAPGGGFEPSVDYWVISSSGTVSAADFNNDGNPDIAYGGYGIGILLGDGEGGVLPDDAGGYTGEDTYTFAVADFNGDSKLDLVTSSNPGNHSYVLLGKGDGLFEEAIPGPADGSQLATADFDQDGKVDLTMAGYNGMAVAFGKGDGTFEPADWGIDDGRTEFIQQSVVAADFDQDGNTDLATWIGGGFVSVLSGTGTRTFAEPVLYSISVGGSTLRAADMDGDGKLDLILSGGGATLGVLLNSGNGTFGLEHNYSSGTTSASSITAADFNGDGRNDLATTAVYHSAERESGAVSVVLNEGCGGAGAGDDDGNWGTTATGGTPYQSAGWGWGGNPYVPAEPSTLEIPGVIFVREDGPADGDGTSWAKALPSLETALQAAAYGAGDQIWVARGYYVPGTQQFDSAFGLVPGVAVYGGFDGFQASQLSDRDPARYETILDGDRIGDNDTNVVTDDDASYVVVAGGGPTAILDGFTVQNGGNHNETRWHSNILIDGDAATLRNLKIRWSHQDSWGGMTIEGTSTTPATFENLVFEENGGRAMNVHASVDFTCRNCSFRGNRGGVLLAGDFYGPVTAKFIDSDFQDIAPSNVTHEISVRGPADVTVVRSVFHGGPDTMIAGAENASLHFIDCLAVGGTVTANLPRMNPFHLFPSDANALTSLDIVNSTFVGNGREQDELIYNWGGGPTRIRVYNSVLSNPGPELGGTTDGLTLETSHSVFDDANGPVAGPGNVSGNLLLDTTGRPLAGSPLINAGTIALPDDLLKDLFDLDRDGDTAELLPEDFGGSPRIVGTIDIGAFEAKP